MTLKAKFAEKVAEAVAANADRIVDNRCETIDSYRYNCGIIYGLKLSMDLLEDALEENKESENSIL